uniref:acid phosphatase n=1 Tax=Timema cristinae TaxID=61476 RepID=A0A7R9D9B8_TIMCR|nr:unnamed protein product [Timema cristinae]
MWKCNFVLFLTNFNLSIFFSQEGAKQQYLLGKWLRQRYIDFLPAKYDAAYIHIRSTDVDRTLMSAESNLAGLYPPVSNQQISKELKWQPIPIHTIPESLDYFTQFIAQTASPVINCTDKQKEKYNFTLPEWTKSVYPDKMKPLAELDFVVPTKTTLLKRLKSGPLLEEMVSNMKKKSENRLIPNRKMFVYSGHDTTVANFLNTLGVFDPQCPPYDALVLIELRQNSAGKYFVSVKQQSSVGWSGYLSAYVADGMSSLLANTKVNPFEVTDCQYIRAFSECLDTDQSTAPRVEGGYAALTITKRRHSHEVWVVRSNTIATSKENGSTDPAQR